MRIIPLAVGMATLAVSSVTLGAGLASNSKFVVGAEEQSVADEVLAKAEKYRRELARDWLGTELPANSDRVVIHVFISHDEDCGLTRIDSTSGPKYHMLWIVTSRDRLESTLAHELTHTVFAERYQGRVPAWANEGAASLQDDDQLVQVKRGIIADCASTGNWPNLVPIFDSPAFATTDALEYSVSASVTEFLLSRADKRTFLQFAVAGQSQGWDLALRQYYNISSVRDLEAEWRGWLTRADPSTDRVTANRSRRPPSSLRR